MTEQDVERVKRAIIEVMDDYGYEKGKAGFCFSAKECGEIAAKAALAAMPNKHDDSSVMVAQEVRGAQGAVGTQMPSGGSIPSGHRPNHEKALAVLKDAAVILKAAAGNVTMYQPVGNINELDAACDNLRKALATIDEIVRDS